MTLHWDDVNARARGLGSRLVAPEAFARLAQARDLQTLSRTLAETGVIPDEVPNATAALLDQAVRRAAGRQLALARRWLGDRAEVLTVALEVEDRHSLRALIRGAAAGVRAESRLAGLVPTPALPERLLRELAERSRVRDQAAVLVAAGHPYGSAIFAAAGTEEPDLFAIELAVAQTFAARALSGARHGGRFLREHVGDLIDIDNCRQLLVPAGHEGLEHAAATFIPGGRRITREAFQQAAGAAAPDGVARALGAALGDRAGAALLSRYANDPAALEEALLGRIGGRLRRESRLDPLGPAPFLLFCHRLRDQTVALSGIVWRVDLGAPAPTEQVA